MKLARFENATGEGVVSFEPWRVSGPEHREDPSRWYCHILVAGTRIFEYGCPCGTCGITFRKVASPDHRLNDTEAFQALGDLRTVPSTGVLLQLARILEPGEYHPTVLEGTVRLVEPGGADDYFAHDVVRLFGLEPPDYQEPGSPNTSYYRFGPDHVLRRTGRRLLRSHKALVTAIVMPIHPPAALTRERIEYWKQKHRAGLQLTAFAVSVLDHQAPAEDRGDEEYPYEEQFLLTNCLLDGHHRLQAAAELGAPVRILALLAPQYSLANAEDSATVVSCYARAVAK